MIKSAEETVSVAGERLAIVKGGSGKPLLIFHDELGYPGWMSWNETFAHERTLIIPIQPGYGKSPRLEWVRTFRDLAGFYSQVVRELRLDPVDVIGYSAGGFIAAEMVAADPRIFSKMILVAPMGLKPAEGEIMDIFPITMRTHLRATVADPAGTPEFLKLYGGEMTPEQFEAFEEARAESARIGWEPYMHNPALPFCCAGPKLRPCWCGARAIASFRAAVSTHTSKRYRERRSRPSKALVIGPKLKTQLSLCE